MPNFVFTAISECASDTCVNGDCQEINGGYECHCEEGWIGDHCEIGKSAIYIEPEMLGIV